MKHESETLERVTQARAQVSEARIFHDVAKLGAAESMLRSGLGSLFAVAEAYPDLKANEQFQHMQIRITTLENSIADRREFYNESVNINNIRVQQFPDVMIASAFKFSEKPLLTMEASELEDVDVAKHFN